MTDPITAHDSSGHGNDGTYHYAFQAATFVPGLVTGDVALFCGPNSNAGVAAVGIPVGVLDWAKDWTFSMLVAYGVTANSPWIIYEAKDSGLVNALVIAWDELGGPNQIQVGGGGATAWLSPANTLPDDSSVHLLVITYGSGTMTLYMDGSVVAWGTTGAAPGSPAVTVSGALMGLSGTSPEGTGVNDEPALFDYALSAGQVTSLQAARGSFAAYSAAVLALAPLAYYHLDDVVTPHPPTPATVPVLFVPHKTNEHSANWRTIEGWAQQIRDYLLLLPPPP